MTHHPSLITPRLTRGWLPVRPKDSHKGDYGHVLVAAGSRGMMGAARLCALGALRGGAGLVTLAVPESQYDFAASGPREAMTLPSPDAAGAFAPRAAAFLLKYARDRRVTSAVLGPGLSMKPGAARFALDALESLGIPVVADADALNALAAAPRPVRRRAAWVMTPHPGEAARLLKTSVSKVRADRPAAARALAERFGAVAVLKGAGTIVTDGGAVYHRNGTGNPGMAAGGMGDVLAGMIAALIPQVRSAGPREACLRAAVLAVHLHGRAGDRAAREMGPVGITASDLAARVPAAFKYFL